VSTTIFTESEPLGLLLLGFLDSKLTWLGDFILRVDLADLQFNRLKTREGVNLPE